MVVAVRILCRSVVFVVCRSGLLFLFHFPFSRLVCSGSCVLFFLSSCVLLCFVFALLP